MKELKFNNIFACPRCKTALQLAFSSGKCPICTLTFKKSRGIWHFLYISKSESNKSQLTYDDIHKTEWIRIDDGSYECLAAIARGNKTIDIACGEGWIEKLAPETIGVDFSLSSLIKAKKNGAKRLVWAAAENLPFADNSFDVAICAGSLEHFANPQEAINEMARVSQIQVTTVHRLPSFPFAKQIRKTIIALKGIKEQPIEEPLSWGELKKMYKTAKLNIIFHGYWSYPIDFSLIHPLISKVITSPSCYFVISKSL